MHQRAINQNLWKPKPISKEEELRENIKEKKKNREAKKKWCWERGRFFVDNAYCIFGWLWEIVSLSGCELQRKKKKK